MSLFIWSLHVVWFLLKRTYGFQEEIVKRIPRWLFYAWPSLLFEWIDLINNSVSLFALVYAQIDICFGKKILFKEQKTAAIVAQHNEPAACKSTIPSLMPFKLSHCLL